MSIRYPEGHEYMPTDRDLGDHFASEFNEIGKLHEQVSSLETELTAARAEIAQLREDSERLDWLENLAEVRLSRRYCERCRSDCYGVGTHELMRCCRPTYRAAIDAARTAEERN